MDRSLTAAQLARLLARLDPDVDRAAETYERLREALVRFFDWRGVSTPDLCADETIDRLARRLEETDVGDVRGYAHGIARLVLLEHRRKPVHEPLGADVDAGAWPAASPHDRDVRECMDRCLQELTAADRQLALSYYEGQGSSRIQNRKQLAAALGLSENALRTRVRRLRDRLELCVQQCLTHR